MSHVARLPQALHIYQGEDWAIEIAVSGDDAPESLEGYQAVMEIRRAVGATLQLRKSTDDGTIQIVAGADTPTWRIEIPRTETKLLTSGNLVTDLFVTDPDDQTRVWFTGAVSVTPRITIREGSAL